MRTYRSNKEQSPKDYVCELCGRFGPTHLHHIFEGQGRRKIPENPMIEVCLDCHMKIHARPREYAWLKEKYQRLVMIHEGWTEEQFIEKFGRNYLED